MTYDIHAGNLVFRELFENSPHPLWVFDLETLHFLAVNDTAVETYGFSRDEFLGMKITEIRPEVEAPRLLAHLRDQDEGNFGNRGNSRFLHRRARKACRRSCRSHRRGSRDGFRGDAVVARLIPSPSVSPSTNTDWSKPIPSSVTTS